MSEKTMVLFSGGLDSTTALYWALRRRGEVYALTFDYRQRHRVEIRAARTIARRLGVPHTVLKINLEQIGGSALTDPAIDVPRYRRVPRLHSPVPPATYVPFRNGIFLALASAWAETRGITEIVCGFNVVDSPEYPDTRPAFVRAMERAVNAGTTAALGRRRLKIRAPFIGLKKSDIIRIGLALGADYSRSITCYSGKEKPCGSCSACLLRARAFKEAGRPDPLVLRTGKGGRK
ncbi:MAG: 7-cyano-7-deazaguanine synthase QueC [Candidatus Aminicenantes bacterium]|nr:7-cyano-7-deazaguanine synthase QueC [Candidatus Aminicenantes bacterium]